MGSLVKWWTMNKIDNDSHIGKSQPFQVAHFIKHLMWGPSSPCNAQIKWDFVSLIWISKVFYAKGLRDVWDSKIGQDFHPKGAWKRDHLTCEYHELEMIHAK